jgi:hypothetical protein
LPKNKTTKKLTEILELLERNIRKPFEDISVINDFLNINTIALGNYSKH